MTEQRVYRLLPATIALLTLLAFLPALRNDFVNWDDEKNFLLNEAYRGLGWDQLKWMWTAHVYGRYIPFTWMTLGLDYSIWGMDPLGYHLTNILWHAANAVAFYFLALALFRRAVPESSTEMRARLPLGAFFAALLFALHPLRVESVAWVTERRDVVSGLFYLLAILAYVRGCANASGRRIRRKYYWGCFALFVLGVLSKEMVVTLPLVLLILDVYPLGRLGGGPGRWFGAEARRVWLEKIPFFAIGIADSALALYFGQVDKLSAPLATVNWFSRLAISIYGLAFYLWKTLLPYHLAPFYPLTEHRLDPRGLPFQLSAVVVIWVAAAAFLFRRRFPAILAVALAYGITLLPVLGIFYNGQQIVADRYSYLACLGWALLGGACLLLLVEAWRPMARIATVAAALVVGTLGYLTWRQVQVWKDSETLWRHSVATDPSSFAFNNLGGLMAQHGDPVAVIDYFRKAIEMDPGNGQAHNNLGNSLLALHDWETAAREFQAALEIIPDLANSHWGLGYALMMQGKLDEASGQFREALRLNPNDAESRHSLEEALALKQKQPE
jgi:tetratricopeptide (TPR) repeat protein